MKLIEVIEVIAFILCVLFVLPIALLFGIATLPVILLLLRRIESYSTGEWFKPSDLTQSKTWIIRWLTAELLSNLVIQGYLEARNLKTGEIVLAEYYTRVKLRDAETKKIAYEYRKTLQYPRKRRKILKTTLLPTFPQPANM